ncbi:MAG TPA: DUF2523 family protein [Solimonas sp.]
MRWPLYSAVVIGVSAVVLSVAADAACGYVNGNYVCTDKPGCGLVNGQEQCAEPDGCGYVNGNYVCSVAADKSPAPANKVSKPRQGANANTKDAGVVAGLEWLSSFFAGKGSDDWMSSAIGWGVKKATVAWLDTKLWAFKIAWSVAKSILTDLGVFTAIATAIGGLPPDLSNALRFFKVIEAITMMLTAGMTKLVLRFLPGA